MSVAALCHAVVATFMLGSSALEYKDVQFLDYCPRRPPVACVLQFTGERGVSDDVTTYVMCADKNKKTVYKGLVAEMIES